MPRIPTPLRLTLEDFEAYQTPWPGGTPSSTKIEGARTRANRTAPVTRARLDLAARMVRWARSVVRRLEDQGLEVTVVAPGFGAGPRKGKVTEAQRVLIQVNETTTREPGEVVVRWALSLDSKGVDAALEIAPSASTITFLRESLDDLSRRSDLLRVLEALPDQFTFGLVGETGSPPLEISAWAAILERSVATGRFLRLGWSVPKDVAIAHSSLLDEQLEDAIVLLTPMYELLAHGVAEGLRPGLSKRGKGNSRAGQRGRQSTAPRQRGQAASGSRSLERGTQVRVLAGPFAGKVGIVKEVDGKGRAQVMLGLLATRIDLVDLSASSGNRRPTLSSSHRKPLALR